AADWWTWPPDVLADLNAGNVVPVDPGADGVYHVTVHLDEDRPAADADPVVSGLVGCDSGVLFIGPGEDITGGGLEPVGFRLPCPAGTYRAWGSAADECGVGGWLGAGAGAPGDPVGGHPPLPG